MKYIKLTLALLTLLPTTIIVALDTHKPPHLTIIFIVDQFSYDTLQKLKRHMTGGIKHLLDNGVVYTNARHPHAVPTTATGHTAFNTGAYAREHGITANGWVDESGNKVDCDDDTPENAAVFSPTGLYSYGKSARNIMVDGISDQVVLASRPGKNNKVFGISLKSRAAICCAGKLGKAIWFDDKGVDNKIGFTSSTAYFDELPEWIKEFNKEKDLASIETIHWSRAYPDRPGRYRFYHVDDYRFTKGTRLVDTDIVIGKNYSLLEKTPYAMQLTLDLAKKCIEEHYRRYGNEKLVLWISLSTPDKIGHDYGPDSLEVIDILYHLDLQLHSFMRWVARKSRPHAPLYVLSADHGSSPLPEYLQEAGIDGARRIICPEITKQFNEYMQEQVGDSDFVTHFRSSSLFMDEAKIRQLPPKNREKFIADAKLFLTQTPGIMRVWTRDELSNPAFECTDIAGLFRNQLYPGRNSYFMIQTQPYCLLTDYDKGSAHRTPYDHNTHVPLILYRHNELSNRTIHEPVLTTQLANTLAHILQVPKASASFFDMLPGVINHTAIGY